MDKTMVLDEQFAHLPVLSEEIKKLAEPVLSRAGARVFDGTLGRGGHLLLLWKEYASFVKEWVAFDQDGEAIAFARKNLIGLFEGRLKVVHSNFSDFDREIFGTFDFMLLDLGVSSPQLDNPARGFSFYRSGPLDMRMNQQDRLTAADLINQASEKELIRIFQDFGEIRSPYRVVRAIIHDRKARPFTHTHELAGLIQRIVGWKKKGMHPATQYFQALRIAVNQELNHLRLGLPKLIEGCKVGGRIAIISFHSLEDRIIKHFFRDCPQFQALNKKVIVPKDEEIKVNPRSRSAKLRCYEKIHDI